jgi:cytochrome c oxidase assembly protein subunit 15
MSKNSEIANRVLAPITGLLLFAQAAIVVTGGAVRLTGSGLGCPTWPECTPGSYTPKPYQVEEQVKVWIEFGNRLLTFVLVLVAISALLSVLASGRKDLRGLALGQVLGIVGQGVLGGITVLTGLHPATVAAHFLLSIILIAGATSLRAYRYLPRSTQDSLPLIKKIAKAHIVTTFIVIILGTVVTGTGPHAGDASTERFPFDLRTVAWLHADVVIALFGITFGFFVVHGISAQTKRRLQIFLAIALGQGVIGYVQWFSDLPEILVGLHLLGSTLVWIASWRVWLSVTTRMDGK